MPNLDTLAVVALAALAVLHALDYRNRRRLRADLERVTDDNDRLRVEVARAERDAAAAQCELDAIYEGATADAALYGRCAVCDARKPVEEGAIVRAGWHCAECIRGSTPPADPA